MRILLVTQYFPPETGAAQNRLSDLAKRLASAGHEITVLTSMPNYPQGRIFEGYRGRLFLTENQDGLRILRTWAYVSQRRDFFARLLNYCSFALLAVWAGIRQADKPAAIVVESPPLFLGVTGVLLSRWYRSPMIFNVSDLWPKSAVAMGILHNRFLIRMASALENHIYRRAHAITGQTEGIVDDIRRRISSAPVELITNGVDPERFAHPVAGVREQLRSQYGFQDRFVVGYTGLHGLAYDLDSILRVAARMQDRAPQMLFAFFGDGPAKQRCRELAEAQHLTNVQFFAPQPAASMPGLLSALDAAIIPLKNSSFFRGTLPSRLFECMAARLPVILAVVDGEARRLLERSGGGICVPPEDVGAIADAAAQLAADPERCRQMGADGSLYVCSHYDRRQITLRFERLLPHSPVIAIEQSPS